MQIRTRGGNFEFLRAIYDPAKKRSTQKLIKSEEFTPQEQAQYDSYTAQIRSKNEDEATKDAGEYPEFRLNRVAAGLLAGHKPKDESGFWAAYKNLQKAVRKSGLERPTTEPELAKKPAKKAVKHKPQQQTLKI